MSVANSSMNTERAQEDWPYTEREEGETSRTPMNKSRRKSVKFGGEEESKEANELPENQEWADL